MRPNVEAATKYLEDCIERLKNQLYDAEQAALAIAKKDMLPVGTKVRVTWPNGYRDTREWTIVDHRVNTGYELGEYIIFGYEVEAPDQVDRADAALDGVEPV